MSSVELLSPVWTHLTQVQPVRGEGAYLYDEAGTQYIDFTCGIGVTNTGHCHPRVVKAVQDQAAKLLFGQMNIVIPPTTVALAEALNELTPDSIDSFFFSNSGAEANEAALKLARRYAVHRLAADLLGAVHQRCVREAHGPLLESATDAFRQITDGAYQEILPNDSLEEPGFLVKPTGSASPQQPTILSRATEEQLFLAVRLSRIRRIETPLPVVVDDSLVNFDPAHRRAALALVKELAATHQVFLLTCHPELAALAAGAVPDSQHWSLDAGQMTRR